MNTFTYRHYDQAVLNNDFLYLNSIEMDKLYNKKGIICQNKSMYIYDISITILKKSSKCEYLPIDKIHKQRGTQIKYSQHLLTFLTFFQNITNIFN